MNAEELVYERILLPLKEKQYQYIGTEFEYLIFCKAPAVSLADIGVSFLKELIAVHGFKEKVTGVDGTPVRVEKGDDAVSFDYSYHLLEFSLHKRLNLLEIREKILELLRIAGEYYKSYNCIVAGIGSDSFFNRPAEFTPDAFYNMIREFLAEYGGQMDLNRYLPNMASVQTHIDVPYDDMLASYNLFNRMDFACALLFANSADLKNPESGQNCLRDVYWPVTGNCNTGLYDTEFQSMQEMASAFVSEEIFMEPVDGKLTGIRPVDLHTYFDVQKKPADNIAYFRSFKHVVINGYHVLEARSDCTQPVCDCMLPTAFRVGIAYNYKKAAAEVESFFVRHRIERSNSELRTMAIQGITPASEDDTWDFLKKLYFVAEEGLVLRGFGEETLLHPLLCRIEERINPAVCLRREYLLHGDYEDLIWQYSKCPQEV